MRRFALGLPLAAMAVLAFSEAGAQSQPPLFPTRDVAITYRAEGAGQGQTQIDMAWLAAQQLLRIDLPGMGWLVADQRSNRAFMVMEQQRILMDLPMEQAMRQHMPGPNARFTREGTDRVAGHSCTIWRFEEGSRQGRACLTTDGAMLRATGSGPDGRGSIEATVVNFGRQDPARFARPQGYQSIQTPALQMPGMSPGGAAGKPAR